MPLLLLLLALLPYYTPDVLVNRKLTIAQIGEKGRVYVDFDVRPVGGTAIEIRMWRPGQRPEEDVPFRTWKLGPQGHERLDFNDLPRGIYRLNGVALGPDGQAVAQPSRLVHIEYGGPRAWDTFLPPPNRDLRASGPPFDGASVYYTRELPGLLLTPATLVLNPKQEAEITAELVSPELEGKEIEWELVGGGELDPQGMKAKYRAPDEALGNQLVQVRAFVKSKPQIRGTTGILVTDMKKDDLK